MQNFWVYCLGLFIITATSAHADELANLYGSYEVSYQNKTGVAFVHPSYKYQNDAKKAKIRLRKAPLKSVTGSIQKVSNDLLLVEHEGKHNLEVISNCANANLSSGNTTFQCEGSLFSNLNQTTYQLKKLTGKQETDFLKGYFDNVPAEDFVGTFQLSPGSSDMGQKNIKVTFTKSNRNFLNVSIENDLSSFQGHAKPTGNKFIYISYLDEDNGAHGAECIVSSKQNKVKKLYCEGTLQGAKINSAYHNFLLVPAE